MLDDTARVAKLADARDLKSRVPKGTYRFNSGPGHHLTPAVVAISVRLRLAAMVYNLKRMLHSPDRLMLTGEIRSQIDQIWNAFWSGGIANPLEVIEKLRANREKKAMWKRFFPEGKDCRRRRFLPISPSWKTHGHGTLVLEVLHNHA